MDKITGYCKQNGVPIPSNPVPVETLNKIIINGVEQELEYELKCDFEIKEIYKKDGKWYVVKE